MTHAILFPVVFILLICLALVHDGGNGTCGRKVNETAVPYIGEIVPDPNTRQRTFIPAPRTFTAAQLVSALRSESRDIESLLKGRYISDEAAMDRRVNILLIAERLGIEHEYEEARENQKRLTTT